MKRKKILFLLGIIINSIAVTMIIINNIYWFVTSTSYRSQGFDLEPYILILIVLFFSIHTYRRLDHNQHKAILIAVGIAYSLCCIYLSGVFGIFYFFNTNFNLSTFIWAVTHSYLGGYAAIVALIALLIYALYILYIGIFTLKSFMQNEWKTISFFSKCQRVSYILFAVVSFVTTVIVINTSTGVNQFLSPSFWQHADKQQVIDAYQNSDLSKSTVSYHSNDLLSANINLYSPFGLALMYSSQAVIDEIINNKEYNSVEPISTLLVNALNLKLTIDGKSYEMVDRTEDQSKKNISKIFENNIHFNPSLTSKDAGRIIFENAPSNDKVYQHLIEVALDHNLNVSSNKIPLLLAYGENKYNQKIYTKIVKNLDLYGVNDCGFSMSGGFSNDRCKNIFIILAAMKPNMELIKLLVNNYNIDLNVTDNDKRTPLMYAAYHNNADYVSYLLDRQANMLLKDKFGKNAFDYAIEGATDQGGGLNGNSFVEFLNVWLKYTDLTSEQYKLIEKKEDALTANKNSIVVSSMHLVDKNGNTIPDSQVKPSQSATTTIELANTLKAYSSLLNWHKSDDQEKTIANQYCHKYDWRICSSISSKELASYNKLYCKISYQIETTFRGRPNTPHVIYKELSPAQSLEQCNVIFDDLKSQFKYNNDIKRLEAISADGVVVFAPKLKTPFVPIRYDAY